jgi:uncharacterized protein
VAAPSGDLLAARLRGFGPLGLLAILAVLAGNFIFAPLSAALVLLWARLSRTPWHELGFVRPPSWKATVAVGVFSGTAFKLAMKSIVMPLLGAPPINQRYAYLTGNTAALPGIVLAVIVSAGLGEEIFFRGYLFERLGKLLGPEPWARAVIVLFTAGWFGLAHYADQGIPGMEQAMVTGFVFGAAFAMTGRIWPVMIVHAAFDLTAVALIYWRLESAIAHFFFR